MNPEDAAYLAVKALEKSALQEAERLAHEAYRQAPRHPYVLSVYGAVMDAVGNPRQAQKVFSRLTVMEPQNAVHWMNLATTVRRTGDLSRAFEAYSQAAKLGLGTSDFHHNFALLLLELGRPNDAREHLQTAAIQSPVDANICYQYARCCFLCVETDETQAALSGWRNWRDWTPDLIANTAALLLQMGEQRDAEELFARLDRMPKRTFDLDLQAVSMLERLNRVEEAAQKLRSLQAPQGGSPSYTRWLAVSAHIAYRNGELGRAEALYRQLLECVPNLEDQQQFLFPLAKVLDSAGRYEAAIDIIGKAHESQVAYVSRTEIGIADSERPIMAITAYGCDAKDVAKWTEPAPPDAHDSPIFIVAFPRSGTTLLEHMLDAHPGLETMDEQPFLQKAVSRFSDLGFDYPESLAAITVDQLAQIRAYYWELVAKKLKRLPGQRLIDKNPLNMLRLPAIVRLFPRAKILLAIRHPCDVITSNYFQHYRAPEFVRLCQDLPTLALAYRKAFDFWYEQKALLSADIMEVRYETFVADFANSTRRIAEFLQIPWSEQMLEPGKHAQAKGFISTPSYSQVIQPVSTQAVGRWRRYESVMKPVLEEVGPYLRRWDYQG